MEFFEILKDQLYQSSAPLGDGDWEIVRGRNVDVVVDLYGALEPGLPMTPNSIIYLYWPILDVAALPDMQVMDILTDAVVRLIRAGHRVLTHCHMGKSRSGLFNAIVVTKLRHVSGHEALGIIRQGRPGAVGNQTFAGYLEQLPPPPG
jgi:protein-tyrosine phosphatase